MRQWETMGDNWFNGRQGETRGDKTLGRRTHHPIRADKGRQDLGKANTSSKTCRHTCGETIGDKKGRQDVGEADTPSNTGTRVGRQWETLGDKGLTRHREGKHIIQHRHTCGETTGDKWRQGGRRTHQPTKRKQEGRQDPRKKETRRGTMGDKRRQDPRQSKPSNKGKLRRGTMGDQTLGKADTPSNKGNQEGVQGRQDPRKGRLTIQQREQEGVQWTMGGKGRQDPRKGGHTIQQRESRRGTVQSQTRGDKTVGKADIPFNKRKQWETKGDQTHGKADTPGVQSQTRGDKPSNKGKQEGVQGETRGDKTLGKADTPSNTKAETLRKH